MQYREPLEDEIESCTPETPTQAVIRNTQLRLRLTHRDRTTQDLHEARRNHLSMLVKAASEIDPIEQDACMEDADEWHRRYMKAIARLSSPYYGVAEEMRRELRMFRKEIRELLVSLAIEDNNRAEEMGR